MTTKIFNTADLPDEFLQNLIVKTEELEDRILDIIEGKDINEVVFCLCSTCARIIGGMAATCPTVGESYIEITAEDLRKAMMDAFRMSRKLIEQKD